MTADSGFPPGAPSPSACDAFHWPAQAGDPCLQCGAPPWEHDHELKNFGLSSGPAPWPGWVIDVWQARGDITADRAEHLRQVGLSDEAHRLGGDS